MSQNDSCATNLGNNQPRSEEAFGRDFFKKMNLIKLNGFEPYLKEILVDGAKFDTELVAIT